MIDISVIIPAWNAEMFVGNAIASALDQDGVSVEVLVADDASTDGTAVAIAALGEPRVQTIRLARNSGPAAARNAALAQAQGRWVAVLDADDAMLPGRLARLATLAEAEGLDLIADNLWRRGADGDDGALLLPEPLDGRLRPFGLAEYLRGNLLFGRGFGYGYLKPLFRRDFLRRHGLRYDDTLRIGEDFQLVLECLIRGARYARHGSAGYAYTSRPGSISHRLRPADVHAMVAADRRFLAQYGAQLNPDENEAARAHLASLVEGAAFVSMVESLKRRQPRRFLHEIAGNPRAIRHFSMPVRAIFARLGAISRERAG